MITTLEIGSIVVATRAVLEFNQVYADTLAVDFRRTADGTGHIRSTGTGKLTTQISGRGWMPAGLAGIDVTETHVIKCAMPRDYSSATTTVSIPSARRSDAGHTPYAYAVVDGDEVATEITDITDDVATCTAVAGASHYTVYIFPEITAHITRLEHRGQASAVYSWALDAEEM